jgi:hypothetical protein
LLTPTNYNASIGFLTLTLFWAQKFLSTTTFELNSGRKMTINFLLKISLLLHIFGAALMLAYLFGKLPATEGWQKIIRWGLWVWLAAAVVCTVALLI